LSSSDPLVLVSVEESECISRAGTTRITYRVQLDRAWRPANLVASAVVRSLQPGPSVVWARVIDLRLRVGTKLEKLVDMTRRNVNLKTSDVLFGRAKGMRQTRQRKQLEVGRNGRLEEIGQR
jgi:hypothetical protein